MKLMQAAQEEWVAKKMPAARVVLVERVEPAVPADHSIWAE